MARGTTKIDARQMALDFDAIFMAPAPEPEDTEGALNVDGALRELLSAILSDTKKRTGTDRYAVAADMSRLTGTEVSKHMIDRFAAPSAEGWRLPAAYVPALVKATGDYRILDVIAQACGCRVLRGEEAWLAEMGALMLERQRLDERLSAFWELLPPEAVAAFKRKLAGREI